jgi:hypothetical protein
VVHIYSRGGSGGFNREFIAIEDRDFRVCHRQDSFFGRIWGSRRYTIDDSWGGNPQSRHILCVLFGITGDLCGFVGFQDFRGGWGSHHEFIGLIKQMSTAVTETTPTPTPAERLREKLATLRGNRVNEAARKTAKAKKDKAAGGKNTATAVERLLTADERLKMKKKTRKAQKNNIERLLKQSGITDVATRNKVFAGIQNGTILEQEKQTKENTGAVAVATHETKIVGDTTTGFSLAGLQRASGTANPPPITPTG